MAKLNWGKTPWDKLTKEKLLIEVRRMYSALLSLNSSLKISKTFNPNSPYWTIEGTGGRALPLSWPVISLSGP